MRRENGQRHLSLPVFSVYFFLYLPLITSKLRLPPPATTTTPLASKCEPGVVFFWPSVTITTITASLASKREPEAVFSVFFDHLPPSPPPSRPNASRGLCFSAFHHDSHHHHGHLPRVQTRAGGHLRLLDFSVTILKRMKGCKKLTICLQSFYLVSVQNYSIDKVIPHIRR